MIGLCECRKQITDHGTSRRFFLFLEGYSSWCLFLVTRHKAFQINLSIFSWRTLPRISLSLAFTLASYFKVRIFVFCCLLPFSKLSRFIFFRQRGQWCHDIRKPLLLFRSSIWAAYFWQFQLKWSKMKHRFILKFSVQFFIFKFIWLNVIYCLPY